MEFHQSDKMNWQEQFKLMKRWYYRLRGNNDFFGLKISYREDFFLAFFISSHHLRDWLIKDRVAKKSDVEKFIAANHCLKLAGDIANFSKHAKLKTTWTGDKNTKAIGRKYVTMSPVRPYVLPESNIEIESEGKVYRDAFPIVEECMNAWGQFLISRSLEIPDMPEEHVFLSFTKWKLKPSK